MFPWERCLSLRNMPPAQSDSAVCMHVMLPCTPSCGTTPELQVVEETSKESRSSKQGRKSRTF